MKNIKEIKIRDQELLNNLLYNIFAVNLLIHKKIEMKTKMVILLDITAVIDLIKTITLTTNNYRYRNNIRDYSQNNYRSNSRQRYYNRSSSPYPSRSRYDNYYQRRTPSRSPYRSPNRNDSNYKYNSRSRYRSRSQSQGNSFRRYNYPYRSPSRPRVYRSRSRTPSQNRQQNRINQVDVKSTNDKDSTKFEIHTCQIFEIANIVTSYSWFYPLYVHASEREDNILPSKLEILFLLDTGAYISVLNLPSFHVIAKQLNLNVPKNIENKRAKTLTVANQTEVPKIHYVSMTCFTEVNHQKRSFNIEFAVAKIKYNIPEAPFFKKNIQNIDFQQNIMTYKEQHPKLPTKTHLPKRITHIFHSFILLNVKNQSASNQDQERLYTSQSKNILTYTLN